MSDPHQYLLTGNNRFPYTSSFYLYYILSNRLSWFDLANNTDKGCQASYHLFSCAKIMSGIEEQKRERGVRCMTTQVRLRISGLVRAQHRAEEALSRGLSPEEIQAFQAWTGSIVAQVETACRQYQMNPEELPAPSLRAYRFLKSLDTPDLAQRLAKNREKRNNAPRAQAAKIDNENEVVRLRNLRVITENLHQMFFAIIQGMPGLEADLQTGNKPILVKIKEHVQKIEAICRQAGSGPQSLPDPSLRAYHWLRFLSEGDRLSTHIKALYRSASQIESLRPKFPMRLRSLPVEVRYYNLPGLYRSQVVDGRMLIVANEAFIEAPPVVLESMVWAVLRSKQRRKEPLARVRQYADSQAFTDLVQKVNGNFLAADEERNRGRYHDLKAAFQQVNHRYFKNQMSPPRLVWGQRLSRRKLGHYQPATDTVSVSRTLDSPDVPDFVVEFIVYHELLHKQLGIQVSGGRRYSHTPAFKQAERRFDRFQEAQEFLNGVGKNLDL
jgi:hypothetical protein